MIRYALGAVLALTLAACGHRAPPEPVVQIVEKKVPVYTGCPATVEADPKYEDTEEAIRAQENIYNRARVYTAGRMQRITRESELRRALEVCGVKIPAS